MAAPPPGPSLAPLIRRRCTPGGCLSLRVARELAEQAGVSLRDVERAALKAGVCPERFARHVEEIGHAGQARLLRSRAAVVGLGGLGGFVLEALGRLGLGEVVGIDPDAFEETNHNRQVLSGYDELGRAKAEAAARRFADLNPAGAFRAIPCRCEDVDDGLLAACRVVFDCLDNIPSRRRLAERCSRLGRVLIHGAVAGRIGQVAVCPPGDDLLGRIYPPRCMPPAVPPPVPVSTVMTAAGLMVSAALDTLLDRAPARAALWLLDLAEGTCERAEV